MEMASGKTIPTCMDIVEYTISQTSQYHTIQHNLGKVPEMFLIIPKEKNDMYGAQYVYSYAGYGLGGSGLNDYPNKLIQNYANTNGAWDYLGSGVGWTADTVSITLNLGNRVNVLKVGEYWVFIFTYE